MSTPEICECVEGREGGMEGGRNGTREGGRKGRRERGRREREGVHVLCYNHVNSRYVSEEGRGGVGVRTCVLCIGRG